MQKQFTLNGGASRKQFPISFTSLKGLLCLLLGATAAVNAAEPPGYYDNAAGLTGSALRSALHEIINGHTSVGYNLSDEAMLVTDQAPTDGSRVTLIYSRRAELTVHFIGNGNPAPSPPTAGWNREHLWPNSLGINDQEPVYSDLFNLRPADVDVNADRGNLYFDESTTGTGYQNPANAEATLCTQDGNSWEPPAEVKGDIARSMFYMDVRYEGTDGEIDLQLTDNVTLISNTAPYLGKLSTLLIWHFLDPVDDAERTRNELVSTYQANRNPFIDHPEWVEAIFGDVFRLTATAVGNNLVLAWPAILPADLGIVETSTDLADWTPITQPVIVSGTSNTATIPISGNRFFRLKLRPRTG